MIKYVWLIMLLILYDGWGIYTAHDLYLSYKNKHQLEELSVGFFIFTISAIFIYSFVSWMVSFAQ